MERQRIATDFLRTLAQQSGARYLPADRIDNTGLTFALVADELRHQYTLEYYSTKEKKDGGYRTITVRLKRDDLMVRARPGYLAPKAEGRVNENQRNFSDQMPVRLRVAPAFGLKSYTRRSIWRRWRAMRPL